MAFTSYLRAPPPPELTPSIGLWQPFASLVAFNLKTIETRLRPTNIRGRIIICATQKVAPGDLYEKTLWRVSSRGIHCGNFEATNVPLGVVLCSALLVNCRPMVDADEGKALVSKTDEQGRPRWAWILENITQLPRTPVKCGQGWFYIDETKLA